MDPAADLVIRDAVIADGSGGPVGHGDVAVAGGRITSVGSDQVRTGSATVELDADGRLVCAPGFIDVHTHDDAALVRYPGLDFKIAQGCTGRVQWVVATLLVDDSFQGHDIWWPPQPGGARWPGAGLRAWPWFPAAQGPQRLRGQGRPRAVAAGDAQQP